MHPPEPVLTAHLLPGLLQHLVEVLNSLRPGEWDAPTACPGWSVHDVAAHILGDNVGQLSIGRDGYQASWIVADEWDDLVRELNNLNQRWVEAMVRMSPRLMIDLLQSTGYLVNQHLQSLDPRDIGPVVNWTGPDPAPVWLHLAREYTEYWHHQQQIREAVGRPLLTDPHWFAPVLATFAHGLPRAYSGVEVPTGTMIRVAISGPAGGTWLVVRGASGWALYEDEATPSAAQVTIDETDAWKLFTKSIDKGIVQSRAVLEGDRELGLKVLDTVSIIA